jgi:dihydroxy-acid dehydratase
VTTPEPGSYRSRRWFEGETLRTAIHHSRTKQMGYAREEYDGKPVVAILNTWSDINPCHGHFRQRADDVKRGIWQAGGFPVELPMMSLSEPFQKPSTMLYRNLLAMQAEEELRSHPIDGAVLMGGCDKTTPALIMGARSVDLPIVFLPAGPMLKGHWRGETLASGSDMWRYWADVRAGCMGADEWDQVGEGLARSTGHCMTMGTASTMTAVTEALGLTLPGASSIPAVDAAHARMAAQSGAAAVDLVRRDVRASNLLTDGSFRNAMVTVMALGGSTNALIHLIAMAARSGVDLDLDAFDEISRQIPVLANLRPTGEFLMEDFAHAGGLRAVLAQVREHLDLGRPTVNGNTLGENVEGADIYDDRVIHTIDDPIRTDGGLAVLRGNLAPDGAVIKHGAASPGFLAHRGPAVVFDDYDDMVARIDDPDLEVTADSVLVLRNAGPVGGPGMPEWGMLPIPKKLLGEGVRDMVRISDARMSGTSYGTCVLHVAPESAVGGPLALLRDGDLIELDVEARRLDVLIPDEELQRRRDAWEAPEPHYVRGYGRLFADHILQADRGCDFDFLQGTTPTPEPEIH